MFNLFKLNDIKIFKELGRKVYLRNGVGYGFISEDYLYDNGFLEIGFGRVTSGYGDWGGGFDKATTCPLKITIDKEYIIQKLETDSFYNSDNSHRVEKKAIKLMKRLKVGRKLIIKDEEFKKGIDSIFAVIPCKHHIGWELFDFPHMVKYYTNVEEQGEYSFRNSECKEVSDEVES